MQEFVKQVDEGLLQVQDYQRRPGNKALKEKTAMARVHAEMEKC